MVSKLQENALRFDHHHYVPCLRWKQGEYQAVSRLSASAKGGITPLIEVPEMGYDFARGRPAKSLDDHLGPLPRRISEEWGPRWAFVDLKLIDPAARLAQSTHPVDWVFDELESTGARCVVVTGVSRDLQYQAAVARAVERFGRGVCVRASLEEIARSDFRAQTDALLASLGLEHERAHLILDLGAPNFEPIAGFTAMALGLIQRLPRLSEWGTFSVIGTSFPPTMGALRVGEQVVTRWEWLFYLGLLNRLPKNFRVPTFGDYVIAHPEIPKMDMRFVNPAASIRYTVDSAWLVIKGTSFRKNGNQQYVGHCERLVQSENYLGSGYSAADEYIQKCARRQVKPGSLTTWRWVGTNHHIEKVVRDLASLPAVSGTS